MTTPSASPDSKRKRRWFQFSLRTFFVLMTIFAVWFGWAMSAGRQQRKVVEWLEEMGGTVRYDYELNEDCVVKEDTEPPGPKWLRKTLGIDFMADVASVELYGTEANDLTPLAGLKNLQLLTLIDAQVSDVTPLAGLKNLRVLYLTGTQVSDVTLLAGLDNLLVLSLTGTQVSDVTILAGLKNLHMLSLTGTQVSDVTILAGLKNLQMLSLTGTQVSDVTPLAGLTKLEVLNLDGTQVSKEQVDALQEALPNCTIKWSPPTEE